MSCLNCGCTLPPHANYCPECGSAAPVVSTGPTQKLRVVTMPVCPACGGAMEKGFLPELAHGRGTPLIWLAGIPEYGVWSGGLKVCGHNGYRIVAYRCTACGHLDFRATDKIDT